MRTGEKGFTLLELIVAAGIMVLIGGATSVASAQVFKQSELQGNRIAAASQVQNGGNWVSRDARMAHTITTGLTQPDFVRFDWNEERTDNSYQVVYRFESMSAGNMKNLIRSESVNGTQSALTLVAVYIDPDSQKTSCQLSGGILELTITATVGNGAYQESETRIYRILPRPT